MTWTHHSSWRVATGQTGGIEETSPRGSPMSRFGYVCNGTVVAQMPASRRGCPSEGGRNVLVCWFSLPGYAWRSCTACINTKDVAASGSLLRHIRTEPLNLPKSMSRPHPRRWLEAFRSDARNCKHWCLPSPTCKSMQFAEMPGCRCWPNRGDGALQLRLYGALRRITPGPGFGCVEAD